MILFDQWLGKVAAPGLLVAGLFLPLRVGAHGELLIRINALSGQIETATGNAASLYLQRAELYREDRNWNAAAADLDRAAALSPALPEVALCHARLFIDRGEFQPARSVLNEMLRSRPSDGRAMLLRAHVHAELKEFASAISDFERGIKLDPENTPDSFAEFASVLATEGRIDEALRNLDAGIQKFGAINELQVPAIELELKRTNAAAALSRLETILERTERKENWLVRKGDIQLSAGMKPDAAASYEAAIEAIKRLPPRLQQNPPMQKLLSHIRSAKDQIRGVASR